MDGYTIENILKKDRFAQNLYRGICARDAYPLRFKKPGIFVINTDSAKNSGQHWVAAYVEKDATEFFDSFAQHPKDYGLDKFLRGRIACNDRIVQGLFSITCGYHCLFYALQKSRGYSMTEIIQSYSDDLLWNDHIVEKFIKKNFF